MSVEYSIYRGTGYLIEAEYAEELLDLIDKYNDQIFVEKEENDFTREFLSDWAEEEPEKHPIAYFVKIKEEGVDYVDPKKDIKYINKMRGQSRVLKEKNWVKPKGFPRKLADFMRSHAKYGDIEFHHFTI